jgi:hypothetical protein
MEGSADASESWPQVLTTHDIIGRIIHDDFTTNYWIPMRFVEFLRVSQLMIDQLVRTVSVLLNKLVETVLRHILHLVVWLPSECAGFCRCCETKGPSLLMSLHISALRTCGALIIQRPSRIAIRRQYRLYGRRMARRGFLEARRLCS